MYSDNLGARHKKSYFHCNRVKQLISQTYDRFISLLYYSAVAFQRHKIFISLVNFCCHYSQSNDLSYKTMKQILNLPTPLDINRSFLMREKINMMRYPTRVFNFAFRSLSRSSGDG